jgi:hypothetical protein
LIIVAERHFGDHRTVKLAELLFRLHAQLRTEELIPGRGMYLIFRHVSL